MAADYEEQCRALRRDVARTPASAARTAALAGLDAAVTALGTLRTEERAEAEALARTPLAGMPPAEREAWIELVRVRRG